jgi:transcriptional regulator with GAF, ATPase, and Fis domain
VGDGGALFLDEIGELSPFLQAKMLRVLEDQVIRRIGGVRDIQVDVRVIAATNADIDLMVADGRFRQDLFFRLNVFPIRLPPLRDRGDDIPLLIDHFTRRFGAELERPVRAIAPEAMQMLTGYPWPGNVRELQSVIKQAILHMKGGVLTSEALPAGVKVTEVSEGNVTTETAFDWDAFVRDRIEAGSDSLYAAAYRRKSSTDCANPGHHSWKPAEQNPFAQHFDRKEHLVGRRPGWLTDDHFRSAKSAQSNLRGQKIRLIAAGCLSNCGHCEPIESVVP